MAKVNVVNNGEFAKNPKIPIVKLKAINKKRNHDLDENISTGLQLNNTPQPQYQSTYNNDINDSHENNTDDDDDQERPAKKPKVDGNNEKIDLDQNERFQNLLKQSEIFAQFVMNINHDTVSNTHINDKENNSKKSKSRSTLDDENSSNQLEMKLKVKVKQFKSSPEYIKNGMMRDYQIEGLNWLISLHDNGINGILADEMGLGKTIQTISLFGYLKHYRNIDGPHLVVVPKSTLQNWMNEVNKWCPSLKPFCFYALKNNFRNVLYNGLLPGNWNVCITSYEMCLRAKSAIQTFNWHCLVVDEGHRIKNENTIFAKLIRKLKSNYRLLLTGTPVQNNLHELWALLNFLLPNIFNSSEDFDLWFNTNTCLGNDELVKRLHIILKPFILRRLKSVVEKSLKPKIHIKIMIKMTDMQKEWYRKILTGQLSTYKYDGSINLVRLNNIWMHLRKCTNHPYIFHGAEPGPPYTTDEHIVYNSGKMIVLDKLLNEFKNEGSKVLLFSTMTKALDIIEDYCNWKNYKYCRLDGNTSDDKRTKGIKDFNTKNSEIFMYLLTTRAGGLGINLTAANIVILYDSDWNPQMDLQAMDRAHRIGQKKQVRVYRFITEDSIEEKVMKASETKMKLDEKVIQCISKVEIKKILLEEYERIQCDSNKNEIIQNDTENNSSKNVRSKRILKHVNYNV